MSMRIGYGWDSHAFQPGVKLRIGGIAIEHPQGLAGHSDGDVLLHAITDALLGALAVGNVTVMVGPTLRNDISLVNAYTWEGGRGYRCDFWRSVGPIVPE